ncbi:UDP-Glycosyltransferase/glycogen phosphorylase [Stemphylium lycopersici]|nr:UDP-Glycosyltransferase/glycogen phosphorylase [Stemphylium lycopersici]
MASRSLFVAGLVPLILAILYIQLDSLLTVLDDALHAIRTSSQDMLSLAPVTSRPQIIMAATSAFSHMEKITTITQGLVTLGYPVTFIAGPEFKDDVESIGATYVPIEGQGIGLLPEEDLATFIRLQGNEMEVFAYKKIFIERMPAQYRTLQRVLKRLKEEHGEKEKLVTVFDCTFLGLSPVMLGAPGLRPDASISIGLAPYPAASNDTFPFRTGIVPDTSSESHKIHFEAQQAQYRDDPIDAPVNSALKTILKDMNVSRGTPGFYQMLVDESDVYLQYGVPSFEYKRGDWRPNLYFLGAPISVGMTERKLPEWWDDVLEARAAGKKIVAVSSSSVVYDINALVKPALDAFGKREDMLVIATLVTSEIDTLNAEIPENARVAKFIPLDLALPYVDVLVTNGGYGTVQQSLRAGVPMIISGVGQDKLHTGVLVNYTGFGIYHAVHQVTPEFLTRAFDEIVKNATYSKRLRDVKKEYEKYNSVQVVNEMIQKAVRGELKLHQ